MLFNARPLPNPPTTAVSKTNSSSTNVSSKMATADSTNSEESVSMSTLLICPICHRQLNNPHMLPCLHVFCLNCLRDECQGKSPDKFFCPSCVSDNAIDAPKSHQSRTWHSFETILEQETGNEDLQRRLAELPTSEDNASWEDGEGSLDNGNDSHSNRKSSVLEPPVLFPCTMHQDRLADTFCLKCDQLACHKCVSSFHRRCQNFSSLKETVELKRSKFDSIHDMMAANLVTCEDVVDFQNNRIQKIESMRTDIMVKIKTFRTDIVNAVIAKEKALTQEANKILDELKEESSARNHSAEKLAKSLHKQMELLDLTFSVKGEAELLSLLSGLSSRIDSDSVTIGKQYSSGLPKVSFFPDDKTKESLDASSLGEIHVDGVKTEESARDITKTGNDVTESKPDLDLALVTSFHGGTREDVTEPLLTDLIVIANGDVILTDRDNKCVKKFNQSGKLLTRVLLDAIPSRIATVSHARAVISVMNKKYLYFLSLFGTVRVLHTIKVKKLYSFLTSLGNGLLVAGTNLCESIDVLNERGETIKSIYTQKPDKASISRPLYLTLAVPRAPIVSNSKGDSISSNSTNNNNNNNNNGINNDDKANNFDERRPSINNPSNSSNNNNNIANHTNPRKGSNSNATPSKKSNKKLQSLSSKKSPAVTPIADPSPSTALSAPSPSSSSLHDNDILVSDSGKRVMFRLQQEGTVAYTLRSNEKLPIECPLGVTVHEKGLTLLVDRDADSVLLVDTVGGVLKKVLTKQDGLVKPCGIYAGPKGSVALSQVDGTVKIYKTV